MSINSDLRLFPASLPDETLASRASRYHILARNPRTRDSFQQLFGKPRAALTDMVPPDVPLLAARLPGDSRGNLEVLLNENTLFPLVTLFGSWTPPANWLSTAAHPTAIRRRTLGLIGSTRICEQCVREDFNALGFAYLHRAHQVPGVTCCWRHRMLLIERCPECLCPFEQPRELFDVPWKACGCGYRVGTGVSSTETFENDSNTEQGYASFVRDLLLRAPGAYPVSVIALACKKKLLELGLSWGPHRVDRSAAAAALEDYYGVDLLNQMDPAYAAGKRDQWFRMGSRSGASDVPLGRYLLATHFLFSNADRFTQALDAAAVIEADLTRRSAAKPAGVTRKPTDKISRAVGDLRGVLEDNPHYTLEDLWARYRGTLTRLLRWDPKAFEQIRTLAQKSRTRQRVTGRIVEANPRDGEFADRLRQAALKLYANMGRPVKISRQSIGRDANLVHVVSARQAYPLSNAMLDGLSETQWHFYARRYLWALAEVPGDASAAVINRHSGIWYYKFVELDAWFRNRLKPSSSRLREGQVISVLRDLGIEFAWSGPCPERTFRPAGRKYIRIADNVGQADKDRYQGVAAPKEETSVDPSMEVRKRA